MSIRVRTRATKEGARVTVTLPLPSPFSNGVAYLEKKRDWVRESLASLDIRNEKAVVEGRAPEPVRAGLSITTLSCRILFRTDHFLENKARITNGVDEEGNMLRTIIFPSAWTDPEGNVKDPALEKWLSGVLVDVIRQEAKVYLPMKLEMLAGRFGFQYGKVFIKHNLTNWGSCSTKGNINLNLNLLRLPEYLVDYVILHELCHLREPNHGPAFHALLGRILTEHFTSHSASRPDDEAFSRDLSSGEAEHWLRKEIARWRLM
ncbi:MAG: M48 family metallopeptidase [Candidatus Cryptobacteroides sp.]